MARFDLNVLGTYIHPVTILIGRFMAVMLGEMSAISRSGGMSETSSETNQLLVQIKSELSRIHKRVGSLHARLEVISRNKEDPNDQETLGLYEELNGSIREIKQLASRLSQAPGAYINAQEIQEMIAEAENFEELVRLDFWRDI